MLESVVVEHNAEQLSEGYKLAGLYMNVHVHMLVYCLYIGRHFCLLYSEINSGNLYQKGRASFNVCSFLSKIQCVITTR